MITDTVHLGDQCQVFMVDIHHALPFWSSAKDAGAPCAFGPYGLYQWSLQACVHRWLAGCRDRPDGLDTIVVECVD